MLDAESAGGLTVKKATHVVRSDNPLTLEELGSIIVALRLYSENLVGESPYIDALHSGRAKLEALVEKGKQGNKYDDE